MYCFVIQVNNCITTHTRSLRVDNVFSRVCLSVFSRGSLPILRPSVLTRMALHQTCSKLLTWHLLPIHMRTLPRPGQACSLRTALTPPLLTWRFPQICSNFTWNPQYLCKLFHYVAHTSIAKRVGGLRLKGLLVCVNFYYLLNYRKRCSKLSSILCILTK